MSIIEAESAINSLIISMTFPSVGCQTCKTRRIKCDGAKPKCGRCVKSRRVCIDASAANQAGFLIHLENRYASGETKRPRGPRSGLSLLRPQLDLPSRALGYYLNHHLQALTDAPYVLGCLSESVSAWRNSGRSCSMVDLALSSIALAVFSRTQHHQPAAIEASSRYCRILRVAQEQIDRLGASKCDEENVDACLLAVLLMGRYEGVMHRPTDLDSKASFMSSTTWSHHDGALAILKLWNDNPSRNQSTCIIKETRRGLLRFSTLRDLPLPGWMLDGRRFGERDLELDYDFIMVRLAKLRFAFTSLLRKSCLQIEKAEELSREAQELDKSWQEWADQSPDLWSYQVHALPEVGLWPRKHFYSPIVYSYARPGYAAVLCLYFAARMLINSTRLRLFEILRPSSESVYFTGEQQMLECMAQLKTMADNLASSIPYILGKFKVEYRSASNREVSITLNSDEETKPYLASWTLWPLAIGSSLQGIDVRQQLWFRSELAAVGKVLGDGVLSEAETDQWATL